MWPGSISKTEIRWIYSIKENLNICEANGKSTQPKRSKDWNNFLKKIHWTYLDFCHFSKKFIYTWFFHSGQERRRQDLGSRGHFMGRPRRWSGAGAPRTQKKFRKFANNFLTKLQKCIILGDFSKEFQNVLINFSRVRTKNTCEKFWEIFENFR